MHFLFLPAQQAVRNLASARLIRKGCTAVAKDAPVVHPLRSWALEKTPLVWLVQETIVQQLINSYFWNIFVLVIRD